MRVLLLIALSTFWVMNAFAGPQFLILTDIHYGADNNARDGEDTGPAFLKIALRRMEQLSKEVDFILNLGDLPTHMQIFTSKKGQYERTLFHELFAADSFTKPMFYIPGNNDSLGGNYQPFEVNGESPLSYANDWDGACVDCKELLIDPSNMRHGGYYSSYVIPNNKELILFALNSAPFVKVPLLASNYPHQEEDAEAELAWLEEQLQQHSAKQLLIAMHVPPGINYKGNPFWNEKALSRFIALLDHYSPSYGEITLLSGHTHMDELRKLTLANGRSIYDYSTPAISRIHHNNPGMKIISLNDKLAVSNYTTYYTSELNNWGNEHYQARGTELAIFPNCHSDNLAACLNALTTQQACADLEKGLFYGSKSDRVPQDVCHYTYVIQERFK
ncbi:metallophosphoesterase [Legionella sp. km772]|uniref:metallophosphoesterase n=1 Tax=Legionella sp. km772 TaxID=2498111 RepID=UPI000F8DF38D|nr:metallophosphoesterase [Legionella sp. km772]RUR13576.1 metallophosphatase [Legionella sp. km772]